jgi:Tol biopolymer transport system component
MGYEHALSAVQETVRAGDLLAAFAARERLLKRTVSPVQGNQEEEPMKAFKFLVTFIVLLFSTSAFATFPGQNGKIVFERGGGGISIMNSDGTGEVILTTESDHNPRWSADGTKIVVVRRGWGSTRLVVLNADGSPFIIRISEMENKEAVLAPSGVWDPAFSPDGSEVVHTWQTGFFKVNVNPNNWSLDHLGVQLPNNCRAEMPVWSPDGSKIAFDAWCDWTDGSDSGSYSNIFIMHSDGSNVTQITNNTAVANMHVNEWGPDWSPDGTKLLFNRTVNTIDYTSNEYSVVTSDLNGSNRHALTGPTNQILTKASWSPDGTKIIMDGGLQWLDSNTGASNFWPPDATGNMYVMNADGTNMVQITNNNMFRCNPSWQPIPIRAPYTPGKILFERKDNLGGDGISVINSDGTGETKLTSSWHTFDYSPRWSADGSTIVFARGPARDYRDQGNIFTMNSDGSNVTQITTSSDARNPSFSPDGNQIVFVRSAGNIWKINSDGTNEVLLAGYSSWVEKPTFSPDGTKIAFDNFQCYDNIGACGNIYVMNADGSNITQITNNSQIPGWIFEEWGAEWSPDGSKLLFNSMLHTADFSSSQYSIVVVNADGSNRETIIGPTPQISMNATWSPDATKIIFDGGFPSWPPPEWTSRGNLFVMDADGTNTTVITVPFSDRFDTDFVFRLMPHWQPVPPTPSTSTPTGNLVPVAPVDSSTGTSPATLVFYSVAQSGDTSVTSSSSGPAEPSGFKLGDPAVFYDISTTATYNGLVSLCFSWSEGQFDIEDNIELLHYENSAWQIVTTSKDTEKNEVCGQTNSLSPFALFEGITYIFAGFYSPVDNPPTRNVAKAGSAIPVKFSLGGNFGLAVFASGYPASQNVQCNTNAPISAIEETVTAGGSILTYDTSSNQYSYIWKTNKAWANSCRRLVLQFSDGTTKTADFSFTK